jgi:X-Pro dipeptidyl-peptidase
VTSTAADAALAVSGPDHLSNGAFTLAQPVQITGAPRTWTGPVASDTFALGFTQAIGAADPLRGGTYATSLTFTLSTTTP